MSSLSIGLSALSVSQQILDITGQNIANANTPGFHRQEAVLVGRTAGGPVGLGVEVQRVRRYISNFLDAAITRNTFDTSNVAAQLESLKQIETVLNPGDGSLHDLIEKFFNQAHELASQPGDLAQRRVLLTTATALADRINSLTNEFQQLQRGLEGEIRPAVAEVNELASQIASLNHSIHRLVVQGDEANDLRDRRDQLIQQLAGLLDVRTVPAEYGQTTVIAAGLPLVTGNTSLRVSVNTDAAGKMTITSEDLDVGLNVGGGRLGGLLLVRNELLPAFRARIDALSQALVRNIDKVHATGLGSGPGLTQLFGQRSVSDITIPLAQANLAFPPKAGTLFVGVTDLATGQRTLRSVNIDPDTQSLQDIATALSGLPNLQAIADPQTGTLQVLTPPGFTFDFTGRLPTQPDVTAMTGTAIPGIAGSYTGASNDTYDFRIVGTGTIGVTPNLTVEVRNGAGAVLASFNIGQGYEPGSVAGTVNGVQVKLGAGTVNNADSFSTAVIADADTAEILPALGLNSLFSGHPLTGMRVRQDLLSNPDRLAISRTGQAGDNNNLLKLIALRDQTLLTNGSETFRQAYASLTGDIGIRLQNLGDQQSALDLSGERLQAERQAVSGVDPNEELVRMLQFQRAFQVSARFVSVVNETLGDLLSLV